ncbi:hypothetical protein WN982_33700 [Paraburkholderia sp. IMGN_8]|uniref:hypothetical protein n=1 Tax=Paraburkholderia sp. IMGN_8 TaxID=3136564 RepID=UPI0031016D43
MPDTRIVDTAVSLESIRRIGIVPFELGSPIIGKLAQKPPDATSPKMCAKRMLPVRFASIAPVRFARKRSPLIFRYRAGMNGRYGSKPDLKAHVDPGEGRRHRDALTVT